MVKLSVALLVETREGKNAQGSEWTPIWRWLQRRAVASMYRDIVGWFVGGEKDIRTNKVQV